MASQTFSLHIDGLVKLQTGVKRGIAVLQRPFGGGRGRKALYAVRHKATHSVDAQFRSKTFVGLGGSTYSWKETRAFGRREPPRSTLDRKGRYKRAWLGGSGKFQSITDHKIEWGVDPAAFPQVKLHQRSAPFWIKANPSSRTRKGRLRMQIKLWHVTGIFFGEAFLLQKGFLMQPRRIGLNRSMLRSVIDVIQKAYDAAVNGRPEPTA